MKKIITLLGARTAVSGLVLLMYSMTSFGQTNVFDDVIAVSPNHTSLAAAIQQAGLVSALQDNTATLTVFAPDNAAFNDLASSLGVTIADLLASPDLSSILLYHVLGVEVASADVTNGALVTPLNPANTIKMTKTSAGTVYANHAMVNAADLFADNGVVHSINKVILSNQTVVDVALNNGFTTLATAVITAELLPALTDPFSTLTVFAPTNTAFDELAAALNTNIAGLLALPNLADILTYHVLGAEVLAADINNGDIVSPLSTTNSLKLTKTSAGNVFVNHAQVTLADVQADNGVVHVLNKVVLPSVTVVDVALDNGFTTLATAVITAELLPALTDPFSTLTVFAPTNTAFDELATALNTNTAGLLALPNLADILTYHVLGAEVFAADINSGGVVSPLSTTNTLKFTKTTTGNVFVNHAQVTIADVLADNGVVHVLNKVVLPSETVVDVALDNGFTTLAAALIKAELLPVLSDPFAEFTVFAPTNTAFDNLATSLNTDIIGLLALPNLGSILLYHVISGTVLSTDLSNGSVATLNGGSVVIDLTNGVKVNDASVTLADVLSDNGVVHVIDKVLLPSAGLLEEQNKKVELFPNPTINEIVVKGTQGVYSIADQSGRIVMQGKIVESGSISVKELKSGIYYMNITDLQNSSTKLTLIKQ
jgi:transforming growth factor-beta-induced protein